MIDFSRNLNAYGPPAGIIEFASSQSHLLTQYEHRDDFEIRQAYANFLSVNKENVVHGVGSTALLHELPHYFKTNEVFVFVPSFWEYANFNMVANKHIHKIPLNPAVDFQYDFRRAKAHIGKADSATLYLSNPSNPTSKKARRDEIIELANDLPNLDVIVDETYLLFSPKFLEETTSQHATSIANLHTIMSLSKFFAIPGIRSGSLVSDVVTVEKYGRLLAPYTTSPLTTAVAKWLLMQDDYIQETRENNAKSQQSLVETLQQLPASNFHFIKPSANFLFMRAAHRGRGIVEYLLDNDIKVRDAREFDPGLTSWFRATIRKDEDNKKLVDALIKYLA